MEGFKISESKTGQSKGTVWIHSSYTKGNEERKKKKYKEHNVD